MPYRTRKWSKFTAYSKLCTVGVRLFTLLAELSQDKTTDTIPHSTEQSYSRKTDSRSASQGILARYEIRKFITVFIATQEQSLFWTTWIQSTISQIIYLGFVLILSSYFTALFSTTITRNSTRCVCKCTTSDIQSVNSFVNISQFQKY